MKKLNIILILLIFLTLSLQKVPVIVFCDDYLREVSVYDETVGYYRSLPSTKGYSQWDGYDQLDLDVDPGALIRLQCYNNEGPTLGAGCFLIKDECKCYDFINLDGYDINYGDSYYYVARFNGNIQCKHRAYRLKQYYIGNLYYKHYVPLDVDEITCNPKTIIAPTNNNYSLKFSEFIDSTFTVTNLKISVIENYNYFRLNDNPLSSDNYFSILNELKCFSNQSSKINIRFRNYGLVLSKNKDCEFNIRFCYESCFDCVDIEPNQNSHQCSKCKEGFYFIENTTNCKKIEEMNNTRYYFDDNNKIFRQCPNECYTCDNKTYCKICADGYFLSNNKCKEEIPTNLKKIFGIPIGIFSLIIIVIIIYTIPKKFKKSESNSYEINFKDTIN